jgi:hypothetical protein
MLYHFSQIMMFGKEDLMAANEKPANAEAIAEKILALTELATGIPNRFSYAPDEDWNGNHTVMVFCLDRTKDSPGPTGYDEGTQCADRLRDLLNCAGIEAFRGRMHRGDALVIQTRNTPNLEALLDILIAAEKMKARLPSADEFAAAQSNALEAIRKIVPLNDEGEAHYPEATARFIAEHISAIHGLAEKLGVSSMVDAGLSPRFGGHRSGR